MPRGMGDGGLMNDDDYYGVFFTHNIMAVFADRLAIDAARILGQDDDLPELQRIYDTARAELLVALDRGAIEEQGYRWMPGTPNKTSGSRWGVLYALYPCGLLASDHELIDGTLRYSERELSPGGHPLHTGWMPDGCWVAMSLDNVAEAHLARGDGDAAAEYLYATLNHATPLYTWCEERGVEPGTAKTSGDRQHLWTPIAVGRVLRDAMVREAAGNAGQPEMLENNAAETGGLQLGLGAPREWLASGGTVGLTNAATHFGCTSYAMQYDATTGIVSGQVDFMGHAAPDAPRPAWAELYIRLPRGLRVESVNADSGATIMPGGTGLHWRTPAGCHRFTVTVAAPAEGVRAV